MDLKEMVVLKMRSQTPDRLLNMAESKRDVENVQSVDKKNKIRCICDTIETAILLEFFAGIFRFHNKDGELRSPSWQMKLYSVILVLTYVILFFVFLKLPSHINIGHIVDCVVEVPAVVILAQYIFSVITTSIFFSNTNIKIITTFAELDEQLVDDNDSEFYAQDRKKIMTYLISLFISVSVFTTIDLATGDDFSISEIVVIPIYFIQKLEIFMFCIFIMMVKRRLCFINDCLAKFLEEKDANKISVFTLCDMKAALKDESLNLIGQPSAANLKIRDLAMNYDKMGNICALINEVFNYQVFMCLVYTFLYIVITIWTSLYYYRTPENSSGPLITITIWCVFSILVVALMCFVCEKLRLVRNTTKILVNQIIMDYSLPKTMRLQAKGFMELIDAWSLRIMIYEMFSVDITLMFKFISVATTYLIVIIQVSHFL